MTNVNDLLRRVMVGVDALCATYGLRTESYPIFKEAHEHLDGMMRYDEAALKYGNDPQPLFDRLTRLEGVVRGLAESMLFETPALRRECIIDLLGRLRDLKEAE